MKQKASFEQNQGLKDTRAVSLRELPLRPGSQRHAPILCVCPCLGLAGVQHCFVVVSEPAAWSWCFPHMFYQPTCIIPAICFYSSLFDMYHSLEELSLWDTEDSAFQHEMQKQGSSAYLGLRDLNTYFFLSPTWMLLSFI